ncbi:bifunctional 4-hydroxy-2-oxoglutarate aldolase/2-dehydro-3-deoxy-phosphogluconate aldolase [Streptomyces sp. NEAU-Y11]|uniref:bifunctional 4-hydroxy-2-oxoglutarate aldolase/2-dehydro-3-deoxy-phosphogluconate aldolase n=1 Tax=Streptomyces cucumeris TaxID=2962890 RepID=UPI0020C84213|nr:bifunctional 4-hydroxy-2-oxoglutarate aldolase/2-dehydro-3-deoxy-phosphogluconate aldolase [Streptomyces sp. NEAU-Y11]MCP9212070.1 bifunctional 4-hydroxy-2-oxoglutarate aldolase/2-dehydro-3-deoxy-phosphogluconate aldolase [Streptomyces sp. NEAU-Y11]
MTSGATSESRHGSVLDTATTELRDRLARQRLLPVLRTATAAELADRMALCHSAGLRVIELTTTVPGWERVLADARGDSLYSGTLLGVGTVTTAEDAARAVALGADFLVSPYATPDARDAAGDVPFLEGAFSPSELAQVAARGIAKLFPAASVGPGHLRALLDVRPGAPVVPTGGITPDTAASWLRAGALAVGLGGALTTLGPEGIRTLQRQLSEIDAPTTGVTPASGGGPS